PGGRPAGQPSRLLDGPADPRCGAGHRGGVRGRDRRRHPLPTPAHLASWAGMTPRHRESDTKVRRGSITKQGSRLLRWALVEAVSKNHGSDKIKADYRRIAARRGRNIARVAAARRLLTLLFYGLRDASVASPRP